MPWIRSGFWHKKCDSPCVPWPDGGPQGTGAGADRSAGGIDPAPDLERYSAEIYVTYLGIAIMLSGMRIMVASLQRQRSLAVHHHLPDRT